MTSHHDSDSDTELIFEDAVENVGTLEPDVTKPTTEKHETDGHHISPIVNSQKQHSEVGESTNSEVHVKTQGSGTLNVSGDDISERLADINLGLGNPREGDTHVENENVGKESNADEEEEETEETCSDSDGGFDEAAVDEFLKEATEGKEEKGGASQEETSDEEETGVKGEGKDIVVEEEWLKERDSALTEEEKEELKEKAQDYKSEGNRLFKEGNYAASIVEYSSAIHTCPLCFVKDRSIMYSNRGAAKLHIEQYEAAIEDCSHAVELNPAYLKALVRRAELYEKTEKLDEALADHTKLLEMDPSQYGSREACMRLPDLIKIRNEKMKEEMLGKLKDLGNMILKPFGLSTNNFQLQQDPNSGGYSVKFQQNQPQQPQ